MTAGDMCEAMPTLKDLLIKHEAKLTNNKFIAGLTSGLDARHHQDGLWIRSYVGKNVQNGPNTALLWVRVLQHALCVLECESKGESVGNKDFPDFLVGVNSKEGAARFWKQVKAEFGHVEFREVWNKGARTSAVLFSMPLEKAYSNAIECLLASTEGPSRIKVCGLRIWRNE